MSSNKAYLLLLGLVVLLGLGGCLYILFDTGDSEEVALAKVRARMEMEERARMRAQKIEDHKREQELSRFRQGLQHELDAQKSNFSDARNDIDRANRRFRLIQKMKSLRREIFISKVENDDTLSKEEVEVWLERIDRAYRDDPAFERSNYYLHDVKELHQY